MRIVPFELSKEEAQEVVMIAPSGVDYNLYLSENQHIELSKSGKTAYLIQDDYVLRRFQVSKTVFGLKEQPTRIEGSFYKYKDLTDQERMEMRSQLHTLREHESEKTLQENEVDYDALENCSYVFESGSMHLLL